MPPEQTEGSMTLNRTLNLDNANFYAQMIHLVPPSASLASGQTNRPLDLKVE